MIVRRRAPWMMIGLTIAVLLVLLASTSPSTSALKLRKPRKRPTLRVPHQQESTRLGPVIVRMIRKHDDGWMLARDGRWSFNCTEVSCRDKLELAGETASAERDNYLSPDQESLRYVVYPKKYEHFVSKKNTGHGSRYRRYVVLPESIDLSKVEEDGATLRGDGSNASNNKTKLKKVTLLKASSPLKLRTKESTESSRSGRATRALESSTDSARRNASDYYAQRRAVMERYYARQREINARYAANRTSNNSVPFRLGLENNAGRNSSTTSRNGGVATLLPRRPFVWLGNPTRHGNVSQNNRIGWKQPTSSSSNNSSSNIERNTLDHRYYGVTPTPCTNVSFSGTFPSKTLRHVKNCTEVNDTDDTSIESNERIPHQTWGTCKGKLVYQHNLLLGVTGSSDFESSFEVYIEDSICITCVKAVPYNDTRATVTMDSGGRGHDYVKLNLRSYKNEGFFYIIKIWAVKKIGDCEM